MKAHFKRFISTSCVLIVLWFIGQIAYTLHAAYNISQTNVLNVEKILPLEIVSNAKYLRKGVRQEKVVFEVAAEMDGTRKIKRTGVLTIQPKARATILVVHGFTSNKHEISLSRFVFKDYNVMTFDLRAHGDHAQGQCCSFGRDEMLDVIGAVEYLKNRPDKELQDLPLIAYGISMGAVATILAAAHDPSLFDAAVFDCPFDSTDNVLNRVFERLKFSICGYEFGMPGRTILEKCAYNASMQAIVKTAIQSAMKMEMGIAFCIKSSSPMDAIKKVSIPTLFITCKNDLKVPVSAVKSVYAGARGFKRLWITDGRFHCDSLFYNPEKYEHTVRAFITDFLNNKLGNKPHEKIIEDGSSMGADLDFEGSLR